MTNNQIQFTIKLFLLILLVACSGEKQQDNDTASGTAKQGPLSIGKSWKMEFGDDCTHTLLFKEDSTYENYNCEMRVLFYGIYTHEDKNYRLKQIGYYDRESDKKTKIVNQEVEYLISATEGKVCIVKKWEDGQLVETFQENYCFK